MATSKNVANLKLSANETRTIIDAKNAVNELKRMTGKGSIDLKPGLDEEKLDKRLLRDFTELSGTEFKSVLVKLLPSKMIPVIIKRSGISSEIKAGQISKEQRRSLVKLLKYFRREILHLRSYGIEHFEG